MAIRALAVNALETGGGEGVMTGVGSAENKQRHSDSQSDRRRVVQVVLDGAHLAHYDRG